MNILGVDPGSRWIGLAIVAPIDGGGLKVVRCAAIDCNLGYMAHLWVESFNTQIDAVCVEMPVGRPGPWIGPIVQTAACAGEFFGAAMALGLPAEYVTCSKWRKELCGKANAKDAQVKEAMKGLFPQVPKTNAHVRDAAMVAAYMVKRSMT